MAKRRVKPISGGGAPTPIISLAEQGRRNRAVQEKVAVERAKRSAPLRRGKPVKRSGVDRIADIMHDHLLAAAYDGSVRMTIATPRSYWERRFTYVPSGGFYYDNMEAAFEAMDRDRQLDRLMSGRSMTIWVVVVDPEDGEEKLLTLAAFGEWQTAMLDMARKLGEWTSRYVVTGSGRVYTIEYEGPSPEDLDEEERRQEDTRIVRLVVFIGRRD